MEQGNGDGIMRESKRNSEEIDERTQYAKFRLIYLVNKGLQRRK
jgi:hypothetical protein